MAPNDKKTSILEYAVQIAGDPRRLSERLDISESSLANYLRGAHMPPPVFLAVIEIVVAANKEEARRIKEQRLKLKRGT